MHFRIKPGVTALAVALGSSAVSQLVMADEAVLDSVQIQATRLTQIPNASNLNAKDLLPKRAATSDAASLLQDIPGVSLYSAGGMSSLPVIHGLADDRLRIKLDGMDLTASCPNHMNPPLSYVLPSNIGSIAVYAGIAPVSTGGDSIGGTIVVATKAPTFAAPDAGLLKQGEVGAFYRSNNKARGINVDATIASENLSLNYNVGTNKAENYTAGGNFKNFTATGRPGHTLALDEVGSTAFKSTTQTLTLAARGNGNLFELALGYQDVPYQLYPNQRMDMLSNKQDRINLRYLGDFAWGRLEARVYHETVKHYMDFGADKQYIYGTAPGVVAPGMPMYTNGKTDGATLKGDVLLNATDVLRLGAEYLSYRINDWWPPSPGDLTGMLTSGQQAVYGGMAPNTFWNIKDGQRDRLALFSEWEKALNPQWQSLLGVRVEQVKTNAGAVSGYNNSMAGYTVPAAAFNSRDRQRSDVNWDLSALARYTPDETRSFEFGYAQKTRSPNVYERYSWSQNTMALIMNNFVGDGNGYLGNPDLKPEVAHTLSATAAWQDSSKAWAFKATPFFTYISNFIDAQRCVGVNGVASGGMMGTPQYVMASMNSLCGGTANNTGSGKFVQMQYVNQSARLYGIDLSGKMPLPQTGVGDFGLKGLLNYTYGENRDTGYGLNNIMPLNAKLILTHTLGGWDNALELQGVRAKNHLSEPRNEMRTPGYGLVNARASYTQGNARFDVGIENLFNKLYYLPLGGAYAGQGMTMSTAGIPWGIVVPGMGRSVYAGVNYKF